MPRHHRSFSKQKYSSRSREAVCEGFLIVFIVGIPKLYWFGSEGDYNIMAMDFLGSNLEELFKEVGGKLSMLTTLLVADQVVSFIFSLFRGSSAGSSLCTRITTYTETSNRRISRLASNGRSRAWSTS